VQDVVRFEAQEQAVAVGAGPPAGAAQPLQERRDRAGRVDLDDPVEVPDVDAELQGRGRHDDAVPPLGKGRLGAPTFGGRQRRVRQICLHLAGP
jgi:hypothetical protein